jgi:hypothetical protein
VRRPSKKFFRTPVYRARRPGRAPRWAQRCSTAPRWRNCARPARGVARWRTRGWHGSSSPMLTVRPCPRAAVVPCARRGQESHCAAGTSTVVPRRKDSGCPPGQVRGLARRAQCKSRLLNCSPRARLGHRFGVEGRDRHGIRGTTG